MYWSTHTQTCFLGRCQRQNWRQCWQRRCVSSRGVCFVPVRWGDAIVVVVFFATPVLSLAFVVLIVLLILLLLLLLLL